MEISLIWIFIVIILFILVFIFTHLRPLNSNEISQLGNKRRNREIMQYFSFNNAEFYPNADLKRTMKPDGSFYHFDEILYDYPSKAAALLKYKKHEWIVLAFEEDRKIKFLWLNKGSDNSSANNYLSLYEMFSICEIRGYSSILLFHNHPNSNPSNYSCTKPSEADLKTANHYASELKKRGINFLGFVCERGKHYEYFRSIAECFIPVSTFVQDITRYNGISKYRNLLLHLERIF